MVCDEALEKEIPVDEESDGVDGELLLLDEEELCKTVLVAEVYVLVDEITGGVYILVEEEIVGGVYILVEEEIVEGV